MKNKFIPYFLIVGALLISAWTFPTISRAAHSSRFSLNTLEKSQTKAEIAKEYLEDEIIVRMRPSMTKADLDFALPGSFIKKRFKKLKEIAVIRLPEATGVKEAVSILNKYSKVVIAEPNYIYELQETLPNDPDFSYLWGLYNTGQSGGTADVDINAPEAWDRITSMIDGNPEWLGEEVIIGVVDSGIDYLHPDLADNIWLNPNEIDGNEIDDDGNGYVDDMRGIDALAHDTDPMDIYFHGTHVAGIIAGVGNNNKGVTGVNWKAKMIPCQIGHDREVELSSALECMDYFLSLKEVGVDITVINHSWGGNAYSEIFYELLKQHKSAGILNVAAAGNKGRDNDSEPIYPASYDLANIISVANIDHNGELNVDSCWGLSSVDLAAPGEEIYSTMPTQTYSTGYDYQTGTSMAAPHVTGALAMLKSSNPQLSAVDLKARIMADGKELTSLQEKTVSGKMLQATVDDIPDADMDDMPDQWEIANALDPNNGEDAAYDSDADGMTNLQESLAKTDPNQADTDGDGLGDSDEMTIYHTDPTHADTDRDGLSDGDEVNLHNTDPLDKDCDNDRLIDQLEIEAGTDPYLADTDGDGVRDINEIKLGQDPLDPGEFPTSWALRVGIIAEGIHSSAIGQIERTLVNTGLVASVSKLGDYEQPAPALEEMLQYDAIIVWDRGGDLLNMGNNLADYHDAGGGVVTMVGYYPLEGRWISDAYNPLVETNERWENQDSTNQLLVVKDPAHPILDGVKTFNGGRYSDHFITTLRPDAEEIAQWTDGQPLIATKQVGVHHVVALNFIPVSTALMYTSDIPRCADCWLETTDGGQIMANALQYAAFGELVFSGCNDHDHCTVDGYESEQGCYNKSIENCKNCEPVEATIAQHAEHRRVFTAAPLEENCDACYFGSCSFPDGCAETIYTYYVRGTGEMLGTDRNEIVTLYTIDQGYTWTLEACGEDMCSDESCSDGNFCNGEEICLDGVCQSGTPVVCDDGDMCTEDFCNETTDSCDITSVNCDDNNECTEDSCNPTDGTCDNLPIPDCSGGCIERNAAVNIHTADGRATSEETTDCSSCYFGCYFPSGCQQTITQYYAAGSGDDLGTDPAAVVSLYSQDDGVLWSLGNCSDSSECTVSEVDLCTDGIDNDCDGVTDGEDIEDCDCAAPGESCSLDGDCCSGKCSGWLSRTCE